MLHKPGPVCAYCEVKLETADMELQDWFRNHVKPNWPDAHIAWAYRGRADQERAFRSGASKLQYPKSAHNHMPARALDLFQQDERGRGFWNPAFYAALSKYNNANQIDLVWGASFKSLGDHAHFELPEPAKTLP